MRVAPVILLFFLAPLFGEFLLGNVKFSELIMLPFLAPLYGGGAVLIREVTRRAGRGYGTMLTLGVAYSIVEEGLVDQLFFNPDYFTGQGELMQTIIPGVGADAWLVAILFGMHAIWSITIPIVLVEAIFAKYGAEPWLGTFGFSALTVIFVAGSTWLGYTIYDESGFLATPWQLAIAAAATVALIVIAFAVKPLRTAQRAVPPPWLALLLALAASSLYMLTEELHGWTRVLACIALAAVFFGLLARWSASPHWSPLHTLAVAAGAIVTYAWLGAVMEPETGPKSRVDHIGTAVIIAIALGLLLLAAHKRRRSF